MKNEEGRRDVGGWRLIGFEEGRCEGGDWCGVGEGFFGEGGFWGREG